MSNSNPIIPPGSPLQRSRPANNSKLVVAVSIILAVHVFILAGVLIQGCHRQETSTTADLDFATNLPALGTPSGSQTLPSGDEPTPAPSPSTPSPAADSAGTPPGPAMLPPTPGIPSTTVSDAFEKPAPAARPAPPRDVSSPPAESKTDPAVTVVYVVKAGDNLTKIAKAHGTTLSAIRTANNLKTDRILVGQKLKVPQGSASTNPVVAPAPGGTTAR